MLNALYQYAVEQQLALPVGFVLKTVKAFLCLTAEKATNNTTLNFSSVPIPIRC